jgi:type 2 lantibiotic biosynthesis protein LanM
MISDNNLIQIVYEASSIQDLLDNLSSYKPNKKCTVNDTISNQRINTWCHKVADGDWDKFEKRLNYYNLTLEKLHYLLSSKTNFFTFQSLPSWAYLLKEIIEKVAINNTNGLKSYNFNAKRYKKESLPFDSTLLPIVDVARKKLFAFLKEKNQLANDKKYISIVSTKAYFNFEYSLLIDLVNICAKALQAEFSKNISGEDILYRFLITEQEINLKYVNFANKNLSNGFLDFFITYPVIGKLVAIKVNDWLKTGIEICENINNDIESIDNFFVVRGIKVKNKKIVDINMSLSDPHNGGKTVICFIFESGLKLMYKPKDLSIAVKYNLFLNWLNSKNICLDFKVLKVLNCSHINMKSCHGWVEFVEELTCSTEEEIENFYIRIGMHLCILHILKGVDCYRENLIANGEYPVFVDTETLLYNNLGRTFSSNSIGLENPFIEYDFYNSVLRTGLLPRWMFNYKTAEAFDITGIGSFSERYSSEKLACWKFINTDKMFLTYESVKQPIMKNIATLNGVAKSPKPYLEKIVTGFQNIYLTIIENRDYLLNADSPLKAFADQHTRFVLRPTFLYSSVLKNSLLPKVLKNGIDRSIEIDVLSKALLKYEKTTDDFTILKFETESIERLDIPYLSVFSHSEDLIIKSNKKIKKYFNDSGYNQAIKQLKKLNTVDMAWQIAIIKGSICARETDKDVMNLNVITSSLETNKIDGLSFIDLATEEAEMICKLILDNIKLSNSSVLNWIMPIYSSKFNCHQLMPLDYSLYGGRLGIVLFLASLYSIKEDQQIYDTIFNVINPLESYLCNTIFANKNHYPTISCNLGIGGVVGLGSVIYSLTKISQFLNKPEILENAHLVASMLDLELIQAEHKFGAVEGIAGLIFSLLSLYEQSDSDKILHMADICGRHLIKSNFSWLDVSQIKSKFPEKLIGFGHGISGIILALLRLYKATGNKMYLISARKGIVAKFYFFSKLMKLRDYEGASPSYEFMLGWCNGFSGIALCDIDSLSITKMPEIERELEITLGLTVNSSWHDVDHVCCGSFGRLETLLTAKTELSQSGLMRLARSKAADVVFEARRRGKYRLLSDSTIQTFDPRFFRGIAGIGYELLRLAYPNRLPSVLLWK